MRESKEDFLTSHVQNFECISIQNPVRGGSAASEISFLESMSSSGGVGGGSAKITLSRLFYKKGQYTN